MSCTFAKFGLCFGGSKKSMRKLKFLAPLYGPPRCLCKNAKQWHFSSFIALDKTRYVSRYLGLVCEIQNPGNFHKLTKNATQCDFLEHWNTPKNICRIWQYFSFQPHEGIPKLWKKLNSHDGFFSYLQNSTANSAHLAAHFCPALVCPQ